MRRRLKRPFRRILILSPFVILLLVFTILLLTKDKPPVEEIKDARVSISKAKEVNAQRYAKKLYNNATASYDSAMIYWKAENQRFFLFRQYDKVKTLSLKAARLAKAAATEADTNSKNLNRETKRDIDAVKKKIDYFQKNFDYIPQVDGFRKQYNKGRLLYEEARLAYEKSDLIKAKEKIDQSKKLINTTYFQAENILKNYFKNYPEWQRRYRNAINDSKSSNSYHIIVDKFSRELMLYQGGVLKEKYEVDLGKNWMSEKNQQGDKSTPEGNYKIIDKKHNGRSCYHKALLLNYPNEEDKRRFAMNKKKGIVSSYRGIGNLIEIHGEGGKGADWTEGCIALSNKEMDKLYAKCAVGTPVTIIGSLKSLDEILK